MPHMASREFFPIPARILSNPKMFVSPTRAEWRAGGTCFYSGQAMLCGGAGKQRVPHRAFSPVRNDIGGWPGFAWTTNEAAPHFPVFEGWAPLISDSAFTCSRLTAGGLLRGRSHAREILRSIVRGTHPSKIAKGGVARSLVHPQRTAGSSLGFQPGSE
jgi:hypothetical protein